MCHLPHKNALSNPSMNSVGSELVSFYTGEQYKAKVITSMSIKIFKLSNFKLLKFMNAGTSVHAHRQTHTQENT